MFGEKPMKSSVLSTSRVHVRSPPLEVGDRKMYSLNPFVVAVGLIATPYSSTDPELVKSASTTAMSAILSAKPVRIGGVPERSVIATSSKVATATSVDTLSNTHIDDLNPPESMFGSIICNSE
jgi:hypothetical protein